MRGRLKKFAQLREKTYKGYLAQLRQVYVNKQDEKWPN